MNKHRNGDSNYICIRVYAYTFMAMGYKVDNVVICMVWEIKGRGVNVDII